MIRTSYGGLPPMLYQCLQATTGPSESQPENGKQMGCFGVEFLKKSVKESLPKAQELSVVCTLIKTGSDTSRVSIGQIIADAATYPD
jgi:hypothetical protein